MTNPATTPTDDRDSPGVKLIPPVVFAACFLAGIALTPWWDWSIAILPWVPRLILGLGVAAAGFAFMGWGHGRFKSSGVTVNTVLPASSLVTEGAYRHSRNPMYVGFVAILVGLGLAAGSVPMMLSAIPMFLYLDLYVVRCEEAYLQRAFGDQYTAYRRRVRRWL